MLFNDAFLETLKDDPVKGTLKICTLSLDQVTGHDRWDESDIEAMFEAFALVAELLESGILPIQMQLPKLASDPLEASKIILAFLVSLQSKCASEEAKLRLSSFRSRFRASLGTGFSYEFSQGDLERVQELINHLRELIGSAKTLERDHQQRLLRRLERLQAEMHKKVSDLDRFWGLVGDAGVVLGKLGDDAKPIVDRIREIADIVWQTQSRAEELPSGTQLPILEHKPPVAN